MDRVSVRSGQPRRSRTSADCQEAPRPIAILAEDYPAGTDPWHSHPRGQFIYATAGVITVVTGEASYVIPPHRAVWLPAGTPHEASCRRTVQLKTLYIDPAAPGLPRAPRVIEVSPLLRELIVEAARLPLDYDEDGRDGLVMRLILEEIRRTRSVALEAPMPRDERLVRVCRAIIEDPAQNDDLDAWADAAAMGRRTFTRTFRKETGMSFSAWRQHLRLMEALSRLAQGRSVTEVALDVGYASPSAFTTMFRKAFGAAPTHYLSEPVPDPGGGPFLHNLVPEGQARTRRRT